MERSPPLCSFRIAVDPHIVCKTTLSTRIGVTSTNFHHLEDVSECKGPRRPYRPSKCVQLQGTFALHSFLCRQTLATAGNLAKAGTRHVRKVLQPAAARRPWRTNPGDRYCAEAESRQGVLLASLASFWALSRPSRAALWPLQGRRASHGRAACGVSLIGTAVCAG